MYQHAIVEGDATQDERDLTYIALRRLPTNVPPKTFETETRKVTGEGEPMPIRRVREWSRARSLKIGMQCASHPQDPLVRAFDLIEE